MFRAVAGSRCDDGLVLEVRDHLLDHPADLVHFSVELLLPVKQFAACRFPEGRDRPTVTTPLSSGSFWHSYGLTRG